MFVSQEVRRAQAMWLLVGLEHLTQSEVRMGMAGNLGTPLERSTIS